MGNFSRSKEDAGETGTGTKTIGLYASLCWSHVAVPAPCVQEATLARRCFNSALCNGAAAVSLAHENWSAVGVLGKMEPRPSNIFLMESVHSS